MKHPPGPCPLLKCRIQRVNFFTLYVVRAESSYMTRALYTSNPRVQIQRYWKKVHIVYIMFRLLLQGVSSKLLKLILSLAVHVALWCMLSLLQHAIRHIFLTNTLSLVYSISHFCFLSSLLTLGTIQLLRGLNGEGNLINCCSQGRGL